MRVDVARTHLVAAAALSDSKPHKNKNHTMATLKKHGNEVARFDYLRFSLSFRSDGTILKNDGEGWKLAKLKDNWTFDSFLADCEDREDKRSKAYKEYRCAVISEFPLSVREIYLTLEDLLAGDIDGLWSSLEDQGIHVDLETLQWIDGLKQTWKATRKESVA